MDLFHFNIIDNCANIKHGITTRKGGLSDQNYASLNLSFNCGDDQDNVKYNRKRLAKQFNVKYQRLLFPNQCHTANVKVVSSAINNSLEQTDALITNKRNIAIGVLAADCVPILMYDNINRVIAAAHAGWKGTVKNITGACLQIMKKEFNTQSSEVLVGIGPAIQLKHYQVGEEVVREINKLPVKLTDELVKNDTENKFRIDLQQINKQLLLNQGVKSDHIEIMDYCTFGSPEYFFSARRDGFETGRFGAVIMLD